MIKNEEFQVFKSVENLSEYLYGMFVNKTLNTPGGKYFSVALSGGSTPKRIFNYFSSWDDGTIKWSKVRVFWVDERCVSPDDEDSNFKMIRQNLLDNIDIPANNIFRIRGENDPEKEAIRYSNVLRKKVPIENGITRFDMVLLGLGEDGHTASIFPGRTELFHSSKICETAIHPFTGQLRITITGTVINNADLVAFLVTGSGKAEIIRLILNENKPGILPASQVNPTNGKLLWLIDREAAKLLSVK